MRTKDNPPEPLTVPRLPVRHGFFTRRGGVSQGPFASLNCNLGGQDSADAVMENRNRAARALGIEPELLLGLSQVHGAEVIIATEAWRPGEGPLADAIVTDRPGLGLAIITADCAPVLLSDMAAGVVGAAHAGWRGVRAGVIEATVGAMTALGARLDRIAAAIGPCIGQASYEVRSDLRDSVLTGQEGDETLFRPVNEGSWFFDLAGYCRSKLERAGVCAIEHVDADTAADEARFFSHRRRTLAGGGPIGHQISVVTLAEPCPISSSCFC
jgi:polyphenol oxidase